MPVVALGAAAVILIGYATGAVLLRPTQSVAEKSLSQIVSCTQQIWSNAARIEIDPKSGCPNLVEINLSIVGIGVTGPRGIEGRVQLYPSGAYGGTVVNGGWASRSLSVSDDSQGSLQWLIPSNSLIGGRSKTFTIDAVRGIGWYPFDSYTTSWTGLVEDAVSADRVPVAQSVQGTAVPGFDVILTRGQIDGSESVPIWYNPMGRFSYDIRAERGPAVRFQVALLALTMIVGAIGAIVMTSLIVLRRRPPSLNALGWLATFLFALLEVRRNFPGDPPIGVRLDALITFPVLSLIIVLIVVNAVAWLRREDWDMENQAEVGQRSS